MNEPRLRRYRDMLSTSGLAIIVFGLWDMAKAFLASVYGSSLRVNGGQLSAEVESTLRALRDSHRTFLVIALSVVLLFVLLAGVLRFYVGLCAHAEARGKRKSWAYVIIAGVMAAMSATLVVMGLLAAGSTDNALGFLAAGLIELTSLLAYVDLIRSAVVVKRLTRRQRQGR